MSSLGRWSVALCLIAAFPSLLPAQEGSGSTSAKVGVIDVQRLVVESRSGREVLDQLRNFREQKTAEGEVLQQEVQDLQAQVQDGGQSLPEEKLVELEKQLEDKLIELRRFADDADRTLQKEQDQAFDKIEREVMPIIARVGEEQGFTLLFNKYESGLIYAAEQVDITDLILQLYDASASGGG
jgi:outer membrane protein